MSDPIAVLQRIRAGQPQAAKEQGHQPQAELCELCTEPIPPDHRHLVDLRARTLLCACRGCFLLFESEGAGGDHFRSVPDRYVTCTGFASAPGWWENLQIPVSVAFFFINSSLGRVAAFYPGPAGATESELPLESWTQMLAKDSTLSTMQADVEAFLVRSGSQRERSGPEGYIVPIDRCYELVGHLRMVWRGFDGGTDANRSLEEFFDDVRRRAR